MANCVNNKSYATVRAKIQTCDAFYVGMTTLAQKEGGCNRGWGVTEECSAEEEGSAEAWVGLMEPSKSQEQQENSYPPGLLINGLSSVECQGRCGYSCR